MRVETFVAGLWATALSASAAILLVLALRAPLRRAFGAGIAYAVWAVVPLAMLGALLPADLRPALPPALALPQVLVGLPQGSIDAAGTMSLLGNPVALWIAALWLLGAATMAAALWRQQQRYRRSLGRLSPGADGVLYAQHALHGPLVLGAWRPRVVLPMDFARRYPVAQAQLVLTHERMHIARGDTRHNLLLAALRCAYWFNPLLHWAAARFRFDQELACDAAVLARHPASRRSYAEAMLQTQLDAIALPVGCHWQAAQTLRQRIGMLQQPAVSGWRRRAGIAVVAMATLCGGVAAWALQPLPASALAASSIAPALADAQAPDAGALAGTVSAVDPGPADAGTRLPVLLASAADAATTSAKRATVDARPLTMLPPAYPRDALREGASGKLTLLVNVDATGAVSDVQLLGRGSGHAALDQATIAAARQWRFVPAQKQRRAVASRLKIPVTFESGREPVDAPPGVVNASNYRWYLVDTKTDDAPERSCDVVSVDGQGPTQRMYCGVAVNTARR
ncbi:biotin transporter BioY [Xanthomonas translucens pv. arrhenatheri]|uniref:Blar1 antirepressor protein n=1 Tax=Xanthomonas graminis pv. arrhenatheri LMG 727 TaxID=1195923 RepID=A0A0K2ZS82_9XANT|nr:TonB family protein [Xanthomonas translucens]OAX67117.1 biotin transporter BioY [Xanthomonas translucens pv. arrhenatheri]UKE76754.1 TonB family protein [Xanthomonas translucens pv. arrhenatheri]CTP87872.1 blar1 antirepressor protein [Xanthomonas translucens pv. arrhenatheri LMG 727]